MTFLQANWPYVAAAILVVLVLGILAGKYFGSVVSAAKNEAGAVTAKVHAAVANHQAKVEPTIAEAVKDASVAPAPDPFLAKHAALDKSIADAQAKKAELDAAKAKLESLTKE